MKYISSASLFASFLSLSISVFAQNPVPTPVPDESILKISTNLIQVDVTVTDKQGRVVTDLKPEEVEIYENGKKQDITNFSFVSVGSASKPPDSVTPKPDSNKNAIPVPFGKIKAEGVRRTFALVVDDLGLSFENVPKVQQSLRKFVNEQMQESDLVAVIRTGSGIGALQSFTSDKRQLFAAIDKIRWNPQGRGGTSIFSPITQSHKDELAGRLKSDGTSRNPAGNEEEKLFEKQLNELRNDNFSIGTLGALGYVIRGMKDLPGRKAVALFSEGFVLVSDGMPNRVLDSMRVLADMANRSSVVIYALDPRGLWVPGMASAADDVPDIFAGASALQSREGDFRDTQMSLRYLSYETGGVPFVNQNNLNVGLQRAVEDQSSYYLLGYQPDDETFDPKRNKFNKLEIKVTRPGLKVRHRSGFFGVTDERIRAVAQTPQQKLINALTSPFGANGINLSLYPVFQNDVKEGNLIHTLVYIDARDLKFSQEANGNRKANFDLVGMTFGDNGIPINKLSKNYTIEVPEKAYQNMLANGFVYTISMPVKKSGAYQFRIALRDTASDAVGSVSQFIEVPDIKKRMVLSNIILDNFTSDEWQKIKLDGNRENSERSVLLDTTSREFKRGTILYYDYMIYNLKQNRQLTTQVRLIQDGKVLYEEEPAAFPVEGQPDLTRMQASSALTLGKNLAAGNYILQVIVTSPDAKGKNAFATQFVEFEIVE